MTVTAEFRRAVEARDLGGMLAVLSPDVVLHSPVTFHPFEGRDAVARLFTVLLQTFDEFLYTDELHGDGATILVFRARVGDRQVEGIDLLRVGDSGLVEDFTVMVRPASALIALGQAVGAGLAAFGSPA